MQTVNGNIKLNSVKIVAVSMHDTKRETKMKIRDKKKIQVLQNKEVTISF